MSPQLKEFLTAVLLDLAENTDWTISPTGEVDHSPLFDAAEKHAHLVESSDWKEKRLAELRYQIEQAIKEIEGLLL